MKEGGYKTMTLVRMSTRGRLTIPKKIRDSLGIKPGDTVAFIATEGALLIQPIRNSLGDQLGSVEVDGPQDFNKVREEVKKIRGEKRGS
jgi:AbrB family looped-hinge helix DNA binding protein